MADTSEIFTHYLEGLDPHGRPPTAESFDRIWETLRGALHRELRRRGLWHLPPSYLGVSGWERWSEKGRSPGVGGGGDALDELVADAYRFNFVERLASLRAQLKVKKNIDGFVFLNLRHLVQERQRQHDPLGARIFGILRDVVSRAVDEGALRVSRGEDRIRGDTVLAFVSGSGSPDPVSASELRPRVERWNDDLLPGLVTTRGKGQAKLLSRLRHHLDDLGSSGIATFAFKDLVDQMTKDVRQRWRSVYELTLGERRPERIGEWRDLVPLIRPDVGVEDRDSFRKLTRCVSRALKALEVEPDTFDDLRAIWDFLVSWAAEPGLLPENAPRNIGAPEGEKPPSRREIARLLGIPRDRLPGLYEMLGDVVRACRAGQAGTAAALPPGGSRGEEASDTGPRGEYVLSSGAEVDELRERLRQATGEAMARAVRAEEETRATDPDVPQPGDIFVLRTGSDFPVEWVVLGTDPENPEQRIVVPADTCSLAGAGDLVLPEDAASGPLTLRCGHAVSLTGDLLEPALRSRRLSPEHLDAARKLRQQIAGGGSEIDHEVDDDPEYREWRLEVEAAVRTVLAATRPAPAPLPFPAPRPRPRRWIELAAAVLALSTAGLLFLVLDQQRRLDRQSAPYFEPVVEEILLLDRDRDPVQWRLLAETEHTVLYLVLMKRAPGCDRFRIDFLDQEGHVLWARDDFEMTLGGDVKLILPRRFLERRPAELVFYGHCGDELRELDRRDLAIEEPPR